jgi:glycosyltransferase involved in cell wall biosynthesis
MALRFLHVLETLSAGGMETTFLHVLGAFRRAEPAIEHHVLAFAGGSLEGRFRGEAHRVTVACDRTAIEETIDRGHDLVHILFERCAYRLLPELVARSSVPVAYGKGYDMGGMYRMNEGLRWQADESMLAAADGVTFTTSSLAAGYALPPGRSTTLRKAADVDTFQRLAPPDHATPRRIISVANLHPRKRLGDLIAALSRVRDRLPDVDLRLVGGGDPQERARLEQLARALGVSTCVSFAGAVSDVASEMARARVLALPSSCEGVPTAVLEAMAAARPVVVTPTGHVTSIVDDGIEGFLVDVGDVETLSDRLLQVLTHPDHAAHMGAAGRRRAATHDVQAVARDLLAALCTTARTSTLARSPGRPVVAGAQ